MTSARRVSNGRSPLVRKQSQITSFFSPGKVPKVNSVLASTPKAASTTPKKRSPEPITGLSPEPNPPSKRKKSVLAVGHTPLSSSTSAEQDSVGKPWKVDVVGRRLKVFWPLDKAWYEGCVKSFDVATGKHVVQYDDAEEEVLDLGDEKIEWLDEETPRSFRRLRRRISISALVSPADVSFEDGNTGDQSTEDEDWGAASGEKTEDDSGDSEVEEDDEEEGSGSLLKKRRTRAPVSGKRKEKETEKVDSVKQARSFVNVGRTSQNILVGGSGTAVLDGSCTNVERKKPLEKSDNATIGDVAERFGKREAEKFGFLREGRKDGNRRRPGDANYNPKTLYLPPDFLKSLSGGQRQWWEFKSKHMDKVLFFKMGKFYELFEMDAHIGVKELDLQYMKGEQPHCGFPEKNFSINLEKLVRKGYRVLVIEQTETPEQLERRRKEMGAKDKVVKREICAVVSKGTLTEGELLSTSADALYLLSLTEKCLTSKDKTVLGVCVVDVSTSKFMIGQFEDDCERQCFSSMLSELRPVEIIKPSKQLSPETERALQRHTRCPLVNEFDPCAELWDAVKTIDEVTNIYKIIKNQRDSGCPGDGDSCNDAVEDSLYLPDVLCGLLSAGENGCYALSAFGGCLYYLRESLLDKSLLSCATFELLPFSGVTSLLQKRYMILDAPAFENLEILENRNGGFSGTLFSLLDHCATAFGKRMLKAWLARPLYDLESIVERQDAIAYFKAGALSSVLEFRKELTKLPDMERLLARLFSSCEANGRNASKVVLYEDASKKQLHDFISALSGCEAMSEACSSLSAILTNTESSLLHRLLSPGHKLPDVHSIIKHFREAFDWAEADSSGRIVPCVGVDAEYDAACTKISAVETNFARYLKEQRKALGDSSINYVTVGKELYLLEVPECSREMLSQEYELRSSRKGYFRYWTPKIKNWLDELSQAEDEKESKLRSILQLLIKQFGEYQNMWRQLVSVTAELDVLLSLAMATNCYEGPACRPVIKASPCSSEAVPSLCARTLSHPIIHGDALGKGSFVPNDINIGGMSQPCFILLSGPNMGGKSTLLRQICLAVVLAQIGADVPAESFELSPVDRIFVRMGARDHIMAGQSTFLTELVETASMLNSASCNSLVVLDELGRGTSTSDGQAIADAVLDYFIHNIHCRGLFSTHYHHLAIIYESKPEVSLRHMACQVGKGVSGVEEVTFLYRLTPGSCPKSYGVNVARLAGLPNSVLQRATAKSREFEATYGQKKGLKNNNNSCDDQIGEIEREIFKNLIRFTMSGNSDGKANKLDMRFLTLLQQRAILQVAAT